MRSALVTAPAGVQQLQDLTRRYARFSRRAAGLGNVLGGVLYLIVFFVGTLAPLQTWSRLLLALTPIVWIVAKETLRRRYYQRYGRVSEPADRSVWRWHAALTAFTALISGSILVYALIRAATDPPDAFAWQALGYLAFVIAMPVLVWLYLWTAEEFIVGVGLITQAAVILAGGNYGLLGANTGAALFAVVMIALGIRQHGDFMRLERELRARRGGA